MTKGELYLIEKRVDEIESIIELCDPDYDEDVLENLDKELDDIITVLKGPSIYEERRVLSIAK